MKTIGFIGAGNMGGAMARACTRVASQPVWIYDVNANVNKAFENEVKISVASSISELMAQCDYVVLSVKPQYYAQVAEQVRMYLTQTHVIVTVAPSYTMADMTRLLGLKTKIVRTMPNTPALVGQGITAYCYEENKVQESELEDFIRYFESFGKLVRIEEHLMPAVVAATGSSPAYVYQFIEAMADAAVSFGMPRAMAYKMIGQAVKGSAEMVLSTEQHPGALKDTVTSPGGTTIKAVLAMEEAGFRNSVIKGMEACYKQVLDMETQK